MSFIDRVLYVYTDCETEMAWTDEWQEADRIVRESFGEAVMEELEESIVKTVKSIPPRNVAKMDKHRMEEILDFVETGEKYGIAEYRANKSTYGEAASYRFVAAAMHDMGMIDCKINVYSRMGNVYLERVDEKEE